MVVCLSMLVLHQIGFHSVLIYKKCSVLIPVLISFQFSNFFYCDL